MNTVFNPPYRPTAAQQAGMYYARRANRSAVLVDDLGQPAWGSISFASNPSNGQSITLGGAVITFGSTVTIGADLSHTLANLLTFLNASANPQITQATYSVDSASVLAIIAKANGVATMTLAASNATVSHATLKLQQNRERPPLDSVTL